VSEYLESKIRFVRQVIESDIAVGYEDIALILCTTISAAAASRWPGRDIDRKRFIELLVLHSPRSIDVTRVSVAALINKGFVNESDTPYSADNTRIFRDEEIDPLLPDAVNEYAGIPLRRLKKCTYAALVYDWIRCAYAHEYRANEFVIHVPASRRPARVSYIGRLHGTGIRRMAYFDLESLIDLASHHAANEAESPAPYPAEWWVESAAV
jgi:hypothetical protein